MKLKKLKFNKDEKNQTILTDQVNIDKLVKYILPVIENNDTWGTADFTTKDFLQNPTNYQYKIDGAVWNNSHVLLDNDKPVGILEYSKTTLNENKPRHKFLNELFETKDFTEFNTLIGVEIDVNLIPDIKDFLKSKTIYSTIGVCLKPDYQNKKTPYVDYLYGKLTNGIAYGMTTNPIIIRKRQQYFKNNLFFPLLEKKPANMQEWGICLYLYAYVKNNTTCNYKDYRFGAWTNPYFVQGDASEVMNIAKNMYKLNKITKLDVDRIAYLLKYKNCSGALFSWN